MSDKPKRASEYKSEQVIALTATFTAEPVEEPLSFWMNELDTPCFVKFSPYNQVFQQLLDPASALSTNQSGLNVVLIRLEDWWDGAGDLHSGNKTREKTRERVERNARDLFDAMKFASGNSSVPYLLCFCPASILGASIKRLRTTARSFSTSGEISSR